MPDPEATKNVAAQYDIEADETPSTESATSSLAEGAPSDAAAPTSVPALNTAGLPYDPATGRLLPRNTVVETPAQVIDAPVEAPVQTGHQHSRWAVQHALDLGMGDDEIKATAPEVLHEVIYRAAKAQRKFAEENGIAHILQKDSPPPAQAEPEIDPAELEAINPAILKYIDSKIKAVESQVQTVRQFQQERVAETVDGCFQQVFAGAKDLFGEGRNSDLKKGSPEYIRREALIDQVKKLPARNLSELTANIKRVKDTLFPSAPTQAPPAAAAPGISPTEWANAALAKPTNRIVKLPPGKARAEAGVAAVLESMNGQVSGDEVSGQVTEDDFPG